MYMKRLSTFFKILGIIFLIFFVYIIFQPGSLESAVKLEKSFFLSITFFMLFLLSLTISKIIRLRIDKKGLLKKVSQKRIILEIIIGILILIFLIIFYTSTLVFSLFLSILYFIFLIIGLSLLFSGIVHSITNCFIS